MNLEELKYIWQEHADDVSETMQVNASEIHAMLHARSKSALDKINRNMMIDLGGFVLITLGGIAWALYSNTVFNNFEIGVLCLMVLGSVLFYWNKFRALNRVSITTGNLRSSLEEITTTLDFYVKLYFYLVVYAVPVLGAGGVFYGFYKGSQEEGRTLSDVTPAIWALLFVIMILYAGFAVVASRWYVRKMFGIHCQELKDCLKELEE
ncbi:MAG: hypothetical protein R3D00_06535 [Bacteroidia bacterium]